MNFPSDDSVNANNTLHKNVQVKIEPGTSSSMSSSVSDSAILKNIKMEPDMSTITQRLTSYRLPRDLTLGGSVKTEKLRKVYIPNLNAQRNRKKDEPVIPKVEPTKSKDNVSRGRGRGRDRGRGRGNLIQSVGVWSEGINAPVISRKSTGGSGDSRTNTKKYLNNERPKLNLNKIVKKEEEEEKLKNLLGDDGGDEDPDEKADYVMLPMNKLGCKKLLKQEFKINIDAHADENDVDRKPIISENGEVISVKNEQKVKMEILKEEKDSSKRIFDIIENKSNSYIIMEFPTLPSQKSEDEKEEPKPKRLNDSKLTTNANNTEDYECILNNLNSSLIGKLEILRSGKTRLRLGEHYLSVKVGSHFDTLQHVVAAKLDTMSLSGDLIALGRLTDSLVCSADLHHAPK